jgi:hypothetical protein
VGSGAATLGLVLAAFAVATVVRFALLVAFSRERAPRARR